MDLTRVDISPRDKDTNMIDNVQNQSELNIDVVEKNVAEVDFADNQAGVNEERIFNDENHAEMNFNVIIKDSVSNMRWDYPSRCRHILSLNHCLTNFYA